MQRVGTERGDSDLENTQDLLCNTLASMYYIFLLIVRSTDIIGDLFERYKRTSPLGFPY